ncbi:MAG: Glycosyl transferase family protein [Microgenomates group bacterium GW2011_GWA1_Microgenomates_45_10]|nr:MAG: Glycosyl transferase family protein [Microgenomates group bacterium GW2011_GWA1_Microgenomates_45_10]
MLRIFNQHAAIIVRSLYFIACFFNSSIRTDFQTIERSILSRIFNNPELIRTILLAEDKRFFEHSGIDIRAIARASYRSIFCNRLEGGSTIEQQYVRIVTERRDISLSRKIRECILATKLSETFSKDEILSSYLLKYKFAGNVQGIEELACQMNFDLTLASMDKFSLLAARLKYPFVKPNYPLLLQRVSMISKLSNITRLPQQNVQEINKTFLLGLVSKV